MASRPLLWGLFDLGGLGEFRSSLSVHMLAWSSGHSRETEELECIDSAQGIL